MYCIMYHMIKSVILITVAIAGIGNTVPSKNKLKTNQKNELNKLNQKKFKGTIIS